MQTDVLQWVQGKLNDVFNADIQPPLVNSNFIVPGFVIGALDSDEPGFDPSHIRRLKLIPGSNATLITSIINPVAGVYDVITAVSSFAVSATHTWTLEIFDSGGSVQIIREWQVETGQLPEFEAKFAILMGANQGLRIINDATADASQLVASMWMKKRLL